MKVSTILVTLFASATAFSPSTTTKSSTALNAESASRRAFFTTAVASAFVPAAAFAGTMAQENVADPTEQWETGSPTASAESARVQRATGMIDFFGCISIIYCFC